MDKTKIFEAAGKYAAKGQIDKAAKEYQRILEEDPKDVRALQKLAEVYQKSGRLKESTDLMMRVAEGYSEQGFFLKAVAVYKQLLKAGVERIEVNEKLAQLYQQLGLIGDATQQYQLVANYFDQQGNIKESLAALRRMVELDPDNVASQVKLGELYAREHLIPEAVTELRKAAAYLKRNNRNEDYFRVLERIGQLAPDDVEAARELAQNYIAVADTKRALAKLQVCFRHDPKDVETLRLLARAFIDLGQEAKAVSVYRELAKVHQERGQASEHRQTLERIVELSPQDPEAVSELRRLAAQAAPAVIASAPATATAPAGPPAVGAPAAAGATRGSRTSRPLSPDVPPAIAKILTETDVYLKYNLVAKAAEHIKKALIEDPDSLDAREKLLLIQEKQGKADDALATLVQLLELSRARGDQERISEYTQELAAKVPDHPLVQEAAAAAELPSDADDIVLTPDDDSDDAIIIQPDEEDFGEGIPINTDPTYPPSAASPLQLSRSEPSIAPWDRIVDGEEQSVVVEASQGPASRPPLDLGDDATFAAELDNATSPHQKKSANALDPFALVADGVASPDDLVVVPDDEIPHFPPPISHDSGVEVSAAHEFLAERGSEAALDELLTLDSLPLEDHSAAPAPAEPEPLTEQAEVAAEAAWGEQPDELPAPSEAEAPTPEEQDDFVEEYAEAEFLLQQGLEEDARGVLEGILLAAPEHPRASAMLQSLTQGEASQAAEPPLDAEQEAPPAEAPGEYEEGQHAAQASGEYFDLAGALADEIREEAEPPRPAGEGAHSVEDVLEEFKKQLSVTVSAEDSQTHYDLGIAYKEMGLYDEAIHEFEIALEGRGRRRVVDCLTMLGVCQLEKGDARAALVHFEQALKTPGLTLEASKEAHFEIGHCRELLGEEREAYDHYARVYKADQAFRDVKVRLARLRQKLGNQAAGQAPVNGAAHATNGTGLRNGTQATIQANGTGTAPAPGRAASPAAASANPPAENTGPRGGRGKIGYI